MSAVKTYVLRVKMDLAPLLETHITAESMRIKASASVCKKNTEEVRDWRRGADGEMDLPVHVGLRS